jgi:hypothetical protein
MRRTAKQFVRAQIRIVVALALLASVLSVAQPASAQATGNIEFLNPSSFAAGTDTGIVVSDMVAQNPDAGDESYRLSAWVSGAPQAPAVEFELLTRQGVSLEVIDEVELVGTDTYEADWDIPDTLPDGPYTIRATLASGVLGIDNVDQPIVIQRFADTVDITYPDTRSGSGQYGMFVPLGTAATGDAPVVEKPPLGNIENRTSGVAPGQGAGRVRAFYTISSPGTVPEWIACGTEGASASFPFSGSDNGLRCTLRGLDDLQVVTAVALLANNTNQNQPFNPTLNQAGDATRVEPYAQVPTKIDVTAGQVATVDSGECHVVTVELTDQLSREIVGANMDVHAWGPNDRLKFGTGLVDDYSALAPDEGSHASEDGMDCYSGDENNPEVGTQGEHQVIGGPDLKHVESDGPGTNDEGVWGFQAFIPADSETAERYTTRWELWLDEANDGSTANNDVFDATELCRSGMIGWGAAPSNAPITGASPKCAEQPPTEPCGSTATQTQPCPTTSPTPSVSPTPDPTTPPEGGSISIDASRRKIDRSRRVRFSGEIDSSPGCSEGRRVVLRSRRPGKAFRDRAAITTGTDGSWSVRKKVRRTTEWQVVAPETDGCRAIASNVVKVKVSRS